MILFDDTTVHDFGLSPSRLALHFLTTNTAYVSNRRTSLDGCSTNTKGAHDDLRGLVYTISVPVHLSRV